MSTRVETASWMPSWGAWAILGSVIAVGLLMNWAIAAGVVVLTLMLRARPFDFLVFYLLVTCGAGFVWYQGGRLTYEFTLLTGGVALMLTAYVVSNRTQLFTIPISPLTWPLLVYLTMTTLNFLRGLLSGYPIKHVAIEYAPVLAMGSALLVGNAFRPQRDLRLAFVGMLVGAFGTAILGFYVFAIIHTRSGGVFYTPFAGILGFFLFNLALRSKRMLHALGWLALALPLFMHQFLSFRRGLWVGCTVETIVLIVLFSRGSGGRWRRSVAMLATLVGLASIGAVGMAVLYGQADILQAAGGRFASIGATKVEKEGLVDPSTMSNIERLMEYGIVGKHIMASPIVGYGLGFTYLGMKPFPRIMRPQWWVHQSYLYTLLKQGLIGLGVFLWVLVTAFVVAAREARRRTDPWEASWLASTAGATAYLAAFGMSDFVFAEVNVTFLIALLWGGTIAMSRTSSLNLRWRPAPKDA